MSTKDNDLENVKMDPDPDKDDTGADRGDELEEEEGSAEEDAERIRDEQGRFKAKDKEGEKAGKEGDKKGKGKDEEEEEEEEGEEEEEERPTKDRKVPYSRFQEVVSQRNSLAERLTAMDAQNRSESKNDKTKIDAINAKLDGLYEEVEKARADGEVKEAARLQRLISENEREISRIEAAANARLEAFSATEASLYNSMLDSLEEKYPVIDPNSEEFQQGVVKELEGLVRGYELQGVPLSQALRKASSLLFREDAFARSKPAEKNKSEKTENTEKKPEKRKTDLKKNADASRRNGMEVDEGKREGQKKIDMRDLSEDDLEKLPESKLRELRGDFYAGQ